MTDAKRDNNGVTTLIGVSNVDGITPVTVYVDPVTHRVLTSNAGGTGTVTSVSVVTANGVSGSVATATSTPAITLTLGAITPTSVNGLTITSTTGTLTVTGSKVLTISNTLTFAGTDGSTLNIGAGGTLGSAAFTASSAYEVPLTFSTGLTRTVNTITVNTSQNIATLSNLTSNGLVTTSGGVGTLGITVPASGILTWITTSSSANLLSAMSDKTGTGLLVFGTTPTLATPVINGLATGTGVASAATVSTLMARDANGNALAVGFIPGFTTTATAGGTTALTIASNQTQYFTGSSNQTVTLPTTSVVTGARYRIVNQSTGAVTVQSSGANTITILAAGTSAWFTAVVATPTTAANWEAAYLGLIVTSGKSLSVSNTLTFVGTDGNSFTFPSGSSTVMTLASADTVAGVKTFNDGSLKLTGATSGASTLKAPAIASTYVHTLPAMTTTIASLGTTTETTNSATVVAIAGIHHTHTITALAGANTLGAPTVATGALDDTCQLIIRIKDNGTARALTWNAIFRASSDLALPTTTIVSKTLYLGFKYNVADTKWDLLALLNNF